MTLKGAIPLLILTAGLLASGCGSGPDTPPLTQQQREDQFWTAYEQRLGMVGKDYADPAGAKSASIDFGHFLCGELEKGTDRDLLVEKLSRGEHGPEGGRVQVDTSVEFLCPEQV